MASFLCFFVQLLLSALSQQCKWSTFSLENSEGYNFTCTSSDDNGEYGYGYSPCRSNVLCDGQRYQSSYYNRFNGECVSILAEWDNGMTAPTYINQNGTYQWKFNYTNGETCDNGRHIELDITWICNHSATDFNSTQKSIQCGFVDNNQCHHHITLQSSQACATLQPTLKPTVDPTMEPTKEPTNDGGMTIFGIYLNEEDIIIGILSIALVVLLIIVCILVYCLKFKPPKEAAYHRALLTGDVSNDSTARRDSSVQLINK